MGIPVKISFPDKVYNPFETLAVTFLATGTHDEGDQINKNKKGP